MDSSTQSFLDIAMKVSLLSPEKKDILRRILNMDVNMDVKYPRGGGGAARTSISTDDATWPRDGDDTYTESNEYSPYSPNIVRSWKSHLEDDSVCNTTSNCWCKSCAGP